MRAWRGPHKRARVLLEGHVYVLDTGQKVHFERLKQHHSGPTEWATLPTNNGDEAVIVNPEPERSVEEIPDDASQPSYREEDPISEASNTSLHTSRHWMDTRLRTRMRAGGTRYYQPFGSSTDTDEESSNVFLSSTQTESKEEQELANQPETLAIPPIEITLSPPKMNENLVSEHEMVEAPPDEQQNQQLAGETGTSLKGISAPLLTNPSITDVSRNFPIWPQLDQSIIIKQQTTFPMGTQNMITNSIDASGHASST